MKLYTRGPRSTGSGHSKTPRVLAWLPPLFAAGLVLALVSGAAAAPTAVPLATSGSFAVLAGSGITNTGPTTLNGDVGTFPTTSESGTGSMTVTGTNHDGDTTTQGAKNDLVTAYNTAAGEGPTSPIGPGSAIVDLGGQTLLPGVYNSASSIGLTGALTLNAQGDPDAVFVFQAGSTLTTASASQINLINGAQACNVFWQIGSSAGLGTGSTFVGSILALTDITVTTDVTINGRVLAQNGAVTLDTDTITVPSCTTPTTTTTTTTTATTTTTTTTATTTTTTPPPPAPTPPVKAPTAKKVPTGTLAAPKPLTLKNFSALTAATVKAAKAKAALANVALAKAETAKLAARAAAARAKLVAAKAAAATSQAGRLAARTAALKQALAATAAAAKATALTNAAARKTAAAKLARKRAIATTQAAHTIHHVLAHKAIRHVGLTG